MFLEGSSVELIDNAIYIPPASSIEYQRISMTLLGILLNHLLRIGIAGVFAAPVDVYLGDMQSAVQPNIMVILKEAISLPTQDKRRITGVPDPLLKYSQRVTKITILEKEIPV